MSKGIFITGTGTDIGKTYVTALIVKALKEAKLNPCYYKAALSGARRENDKLIPEDAEYVKKIAGLTEPLEKLVSYTYETAVSPHLAAKLEHLPASLNKIEADYKDLEARYGYMVVEGSGGIICPLRYDNEQSFLLEDVIKRLELDVIVIADAGLGTINSTYLTLHYLKAKGIRVQGVILNHYLDTFLHQDNKKMLEVLTDVPILATVAPHATTISLDDFIQTIQTKKGN